MNAKNRILISLLILLIFVFGIVAGFRLGYHNGFNKGYYHGFDEGEIWDSGYSNGYVAGYTAGDFSELTYQHHFNNSVWKDIYNNSDEFLKTTTRKQRPRKCWNDAMS